MDRKEIKILLVDPESPYKAPNLGLLYLASSLKKSKYQLYLLDLNNKRIDNPIKRTISIIQTYGITHIGVSISDVNYSWSQSYLNKVKSILPEITAIVGGPQINALGKKVLAENQSIDYAFMGECENSLHDFLACQESQQSSRNVNGLIYRAQNQIVANTVDRPGELDLIPFPDYAMMGITNISGYMLLTSRGCPYHCTFCARNTGSKWRTRSINNVMQELLHAINNYQINTFRIVDASFNLNEKRVLNFCNELLRNKITLPWMVSGIRADRITDASVKAMKQANCHLLAMGIESIDPLVFSNIQKGETLDDIFNAIQICKQHSLDVGCYMIQGLPGDNFQRSIKYARKLQALEPDYVMYNQAIPFAGTELYKWVDEHGNFNSTYSWMQTRDFENVSFWTENYPIDERLKAFRIIQTIVKVINFCSESSLKSDEIINEIKRYDPEYLDDHLSYIEKNKRPNRNVIKEIHRESSFVYRNNYSGCMDITNMEMV